ncbi:MAG: DUF1697 domain-containing protein [Microscillaceae bacterium]|jgi:uncharacterized protein (DUF1697 family)|nr:DUF1697 domain-containing protein [Microscillaceae bacterium]
MEKYVAFLRAINVSGHNLIKMSDLKTSFEALGLKKVHTYIQSGNVAFERKSIASEQLRSQIEQQLKQDYGNEIITIIRTLAEMQSVVANHPFSAQVLVGDKKIYVAFLAEAPLPDLAVAVEKMSNEDENFVIQDKHLYYWGSKGLKKELFSNNFIERKLKVAATTRNWNTVNKMLEF